MTCDTRQEINRLKNLFKCVCEILPRRKDVRITNNLNITVMQADLSEFKFRYVVNGWIDDAIRAGNLLDGPAATEHAHYN